MCEKSCTGRSINCARFFVPMKKDLTFDFKTCIIPLIIPNTAKSFSLYGDTSISAGAPIGAIGLLEV